MKDPESIWRGNTIERARRFGQFAPGTDMLAYGELSGPDGEHITLIRETRHTPEDIATAKRRCRIAWDVTGFTVIHAADGQPVGQTGLPETGESPLP